MTAGQKTVLYEESMDLGFAGQVCAMPGANNVLECIQCGTCSGSCPVSWAMEETPRRIFAMLRAGMRDKVLSSPTIWTCSSCHSCMVTCPKQINISGVMHNLKRLSIKGEYKGSGYTKSLTAHFINQVSRYGRNQELGLITRYFLSNRPWGALAMSGVGLRLFIKGRLPLRKESIHNVNGLRKLLRKALDMRGL